MTMNKAQGNMYGEWVSHTWNPLLGKCQHDCDYCWVKSLRYPAIKTRYSGEYRLDEKAMNDNLGKENKIFVCSCNDLFERNVPTDMIEKILNKCSGNRTNQYIFQSKNPERMNNYTFNMDCILGTTIESNRQRAIRANGTLLEDRVIGLAYLHTKRFITIEPIMDFDLDEFVEMLKMTGADFINIGADSQHNNLPEPSKEKTLELIHELRKFAEVKIKKNLKRIIGDMQ